VNECKPLQHGKVCYLTVQESAVTAQQSQRRPGLHIEAPPLSSDSSAINGPAGHLVLAHWGGGVNRTSWATTPLTTVTTQTTSTDLRIT